MEIWQAIVLGAVQGITEWLPVSSSGHLAIFQTLFGLSVPISFDILLHFATLLVLLVHYSSDLLKIVKSWLTFDYSSSDFKLGLFLIVGTFVTGVIGLYFKDLFASFFHNLFAVGMALIFTGVVLLLSRLVSVGSEGAEGALGSRAARFKKGFGLDVPRSILIGMAQGLAVIPGVSRSGMTICVGQFLGIDREKAARFSFLLAIPAILGATVLEIGGLFGSGLAFWPVFIGFIVTFLVGYLSLKWLLSVISKGGFWKFGFYCLTIGFLLVFAF